MITELNFQKISHKQLVDWITANSNKNIELRGYVSLKIFLFLDPVIFGNTMFYCRIKMHFSTKKTIEKLSEKTKMSIKEADGNFTHVIDLCKNLLFDALSHNGNIFDIIDPIVSDSLCHVHSVLILHTLLKCYNLDRCSYDVDRLQENDIEILSNAVLLSLMKVLQSDKINFVIHELSLEDFCNFIHKSKRQERKFIAGVKAKFNSESVRLLRSLGTGEVKCILNKCSAFIHHSHFQLNVLPCYATMFALFGYIRDNGLPIIVVLRRIVRTTVEMNVKYRVHSREIMFFQFDQGRYKLGENLSECDKLRPVITFNCFSSIDFGSSNSNYMSKFSKYIEESEFPSTKFLINCDIVNLLMMAMANHTQLCESSELQLPKGHVNRDAYCKMLYKTSSTAFIEKSYCVESEFELNCNNIYEQYISHFNLGLECNSDHNPYADFTNGVFKRTNNNILLGMEHVTVSNYYNEYRQKICFTSEVDQYEKAEDLNTKNGIIEALKKMKYDLICVNK